MAIVGLGGMLALVAFQMVCVNQVHSLLTFSLDSDKTVAPEQMGTFRKLTTALLGVRNPKPGIAEGPGDLGMHYRELRIGNERSDSLSGWLINGERSGELVILFHGYAASKSSLLQEAQYFVSLGYSTLIVDFYGSGHSSGHHTSVGYFEALDVASVVKWAQNHLELERIYLYGQSMGAAAILRAIAVHDTRVDGIVLEAVFDKLEATIGNRFEAMGFPQFPAVPSMLFWAQALYGIEGWHHNPVDYAPRVTIPVLLMHGKLDIRAKLAEGKNVFAHLASSRKQMLVFDQCGHERYVDCSPVLWKQGVQSFLQSLD